MPAKEKQTTAMRHNFRIIQTLFLSLTFLFISIENAQSEQLIPLTIKKGSNLIHLARDYCTSRDAWKKIAQINRIAPPYNVKEDQEINIPLSLLLTEELTAKVTHTKGDAQKQWENGQLRALYKDDLLAPGQSIITGEDGYVQLRFPNNKSTRIDPNSKLKLTTLFKLIDGTTKAELFLEHGRIVHDVKRNLEKNETFQTHTAVSITGIRGTTYRMKMVDPETNFVETLKGTVSLSGSNNRSLLVKQGEGSKVVKDKAPEPPRSLPAPPPVPQIESVYKTVPIMIQTTELKNVKNLRLRLAKDRQGQIGVWEQMIKPGNDFVLPAIDDGNYYAFLSALDNEDYESKPAEPKHFTVRTVPSAPFITAPQSNLKTWKKTMAFKWLNVDTATNYLTELSEKKDFSTIINSSYITQVQLETKELVAGEYFFRVKSIAADGFESNYSQPIQFTLVEKPSMASISTGTSDNIQLQWASIGKNCTYDLEIATDKAFSTIIMSKEGLTDTSYTLQEKLDYGSYYVRVRGSLENGLVSGWTPAQNMEIEYTSEGWEYWIAAAFLLLVLL